MTDSVVELATELRQALTDVFGTLTGLGTDEQRREALRTALGDVTPGALLGRLTALGADQAGQLLPTLVTILARAIGQAAPDWHLEIPGSLRVDAAHVEVLAPTLPSDLRFELRVGTVEITTGVDVRDGITLTLTVPADATKASLLVTIGGLSLAPPGDALLALLLPGGGPLFEGDVTARADAKGVSFDGGGRSGVSLPLKTAPPLLKAPALYLAPRDTAIRLTLSFGASLFGLAVPATDTVAALPIEQALRADRALLGPSVSAAARRDGVLALTGQERPWSRTLAEMDAGLQYLAKRVRDWGHAGRDPFAMVERLLGECLDLVSHRLDAWITSLATARLAAMRAPGARPTGLQLGAYGWVEDLSPRDTAATARSSGYVLAPSVPQATTAAVLRSGFLSHPDDPGAFAVDLSSRRMRTAMTILDGVRQGQPLGALLGYRLERRLHEARTDDRQRLELDRVIAPLRALAPLQPVPGVAPGDTPEVVTAHDVVDGRRISERTVAEVLADLSVKVTPQLGVVDEVPAVAAALAALHDDVDALADLLLAESVHQLTGRNPERAGATLQTLAAGGHPPPRPEVLDIPRQGTPVTHRLLIVLPEVVAPAAGWNTTAQTVRARARAEPRLDAWASRLLAPPDRIRLRASWRSPGRDPATATVVEHRWPLTDHCALDVAALAGAGVLRAALAAALVRPPDLPADALPVPLDDRDPAWNHDVVALPEVDALARAVAAVLAGATPGGPAQLRTATAAVPPPVEGDLRDRAVHARDRLRTAEEGGDLDLMAQYGVVPPGLPGQEPATVLAAARREATARLARADEALSPAPGAPGPAAALEAVFGTGFRAVDLIAAPDPQELGDSLGAGLVRGDDEQAPRDWLERMGAVRTGAGRLADLLLYADATGTGGGQALRVGQTPFRAGDHWVAAPGPAATVSPATGLVLHGPADLDPTARLAVAVVDEWSEVVPGRTRTAGAAFHFDAPGTRPPQSLLLAVPPVPGAPWTLATLAAVLGEALDLAKLRLVDLQALAWLGRYLPAAYLPDTALGTAPGVLFKELMAEAVRRRVFDVMLKKES